MEKIFRSIGLPLDEKIFSQHVNLNFSLLEDKWIKLLLTHQLTMFANDEISSKKESPHQGNDSLKLNLTREEMIEKSKKLSYSYYNYLANTDIQYLSNPGEAIFVSLIFNLFDENLFQILSARNYIITIIIIWIISNKRFDISIHVTSYFVYINDDYAALILDKLGYEEIYKIFVNLNHIKDLITTGDFKIILNNKDLQYIYLLMNSKYIEIIVKKLGFKSYREFYQAVKLRKRLKCSRSILLQIIELIVNYKPDVINKLIIDKGIMIPDGVESHDYVLKNLYDYNEIFSRNLKKDQITCILFTEKKKLFYYTDYELIFFTNIYPYFTSREDLIKEIWNLKTKPGFFLPFNFSSFKSINKTSFSDDIFNERSERNLIAFGLINQYHLFTPEDLAGSFNLTRFSETSIAFHPYTKFNAFPPEKLLKLYEITKILHIDNLIFIKPFEEYLQATNRFFKIKKLFKEWKNDSGNIKDLSLILEIMLSIVESQKSKIPVTESGFLSEIEMPTAEEIYQNFSNLLENWDISTRKFLGSLFLVDNEQIFLLEHFHCFLVEQLSPDVTLSLKHQLEITLNIYRLMVS